MLISTKGRYALRILVDMAEHQAQGYVPLHEIACRQEISEKYLESIVKDLVKQGVVIGVRGKGGGYRLCRSADQINIGDILCATEGTLAPVSCLDHNARPCPKSSFCRTLHFWKGLDEVIRGYTQSYTVADLMQPDLPGDDYAI